MADVDAWFRQRRVVNGLLIGLISLLFAAATALVYTTGGTKFAWPYVILIPILIAAARFGVIGGILGGLTGGLLLAPFMPLDVAAGIAQEAGTRRGARGDRGSGRPLCR